MTEFEKRNEDWLEEFKEYLDEFEEKISKNPKLPQKMDRSTLTRFLQTYNCDVDKALNLLEINVNFKRKNLNIFSNRDINSPEIQQAVNTLELTVFPVRTKENYQILGFRLVDHDSKNFHYEHIIKYILMYQDMLMYVTSKNEGDICIFDATGFSFWHFLKAVANPSVIKAFMFYEQEATPTRLKQNHIVNVSPTVVKLVSFLKPFVNKEVMETFHLHCSGYDTLHQHLPKDALPVEFGGTVGSLTEYYKKTVSGFKISREFLLNDSNFF